jgi:nucleotide-binding universal stress UspA family protein
MTAETSDRPGDLRLRQVLVPLDGSEFALRALPTARVLADRLDAEVHTVSVAGADDDAARLRRLAAAALGIDDGDDKVLVVAEGDPSEVIARRAEELGSCVVCLSTHGRGRLHGAVVGSVARSVLQRSSAPLVALGPMADNPGWTPRPRSWPEPLSTPRLVACVDGSAPSEQVLPIAASWASALGMSMTILTVADDDPPSIRPVEGRRYGSHTAPQPYVDDLVDQWRGQVEQVDGEVVRDAIGTAEGIRRHLAQRPAGLVAVTTHARSGTQRVLVGATAASIVHASVAPCLVAPVHS